MPDRIESYRKVLEEFCIETDEPFSHTGAEDAAEFLANPETIKRFCVVTGSGEYAYAKPGFDSFEEARSGSVESVDDRVYCECPIAIVDLDEGKQWKPDWLNVPWSESVPA